MHLKAWTMRQGGPCERDGARESCLRIVPLGNLAELESPKALGEERPDHREIQMSELPPGQGRVLVLDLDEDQPPLLPVEEDSVRLTPAQLLAAGGLEAEPGTRQVIPLMLAKEVLLHLLLILNSLDLVVPNY